MNVASAFCVVSEGVLLLRGGTSPWCAQNHHPLINQSSDWSVERRPDSCRYRQSEVFEYLLSFFQLTCRRSFPTFLSCLHCICQIKLKKAKKPPNTPTFISLFIRMAGMCDEHLYSHRGCGGPLQAFCWDLAMVMALVLSG